MAIILEAVAANGAVQRMPLSGATTTVAAQPGLRYRLLNDAGGRVSQAALVKRLDGDLLVDGLPEGKILSLEGFFTRCTPQDTCALSMDNIGGAPDENVTPATQPVSALPEGGFLMYASGMTASSVAPAPESEFSYKPFLGVAGGLVIVGGAGGGGGGGSKSSDTTPPDAPTITSGAFTNKTQPVFTGTAEAGTTVTMTLDVGMNGSSDVTYSTSVAANGTWVIDTATATPTTGSLGTIGEGVQILVIARATDSAGNISAPTQGVVQLDTGVPVAPTITSALLTNDTTPLIEGTAEPGSIVTVALDLDGNGSSDVSWTTTTLNSGTYRVDLGNAPTSGSLPGSKLGDTSTTAMSVVASDLAGNASPTTNAVLRVDTTIPPAPTIVTIAGEALSNPVIAINASEALSPVTITGTLLPSHADRPVSVQWDTLAPRAATVSGTNWTITFAGADIPDDGVRTVRVTFVSAAGTTSAEATRGVLIDTVPPSAPVIAAIPEADNGGISGAEAANGTTVTVGLAGTLSAAGDTLRIQWGSQTATDYTITGADIGGATATVTINPGVIVAQGDGSVTVTARIIDVAGNVGASSAGFPVLVDAAAPAQAATVIAVVDNVAPVTGTVASGGTTNDTAPAVSGTLSAGLGAGESVQVLRDGAVIGTASVSGTDWSYADSGLSNGNSYAYTARVVDGAGNLGATGTPYSIAVDTVAPAQAATVTAIVDNVAPVTGTVASGGTTNDTAPAVSGTLSAGLGAGESVQVLRDGAVIGTASVSGAAWSYADSGLSNGNSYAYTARVVDGAGNQGTTSASYSISVVTAAPSKTATVIAVVDNVAPVTGTVASGGTTNDTAPAVSGTLSAGLGAGESVQVLRDGAVIGTASVSGTDWSYADSGLSNGNSYAYTARVVDGAGNLGATGTPYSIAVDTVAPAQAATVTAIVDNVAPVTGTVASGGTTNDTAPAVSGTLSAGLGAGESVQVLRDGAVIGTASVSGAAWSYADSGLSNGNSYAYTARVVDGAGNQGTTSASYSISVVTAAPSKTATVIAVVDNVAPVTGTVASGGTTNDTAPAVSGTLSAGLGAGESVQVLRDGAVIGTASVSGTDWSYADSGLSNGNSYAYTARVVDGAGNLGATGTPYSIAVDTSIPPAPTIGTIAVDDRVNAIEAGAAVTISGTLSEADRPVTVQWGSTAARAATVVGTDWSVTYASSDIPVDGVQTLRVTYINDAGTTSVEATRTVLVDRVAPGAPTIALNPLSDSGTPGDFLTNDDTPTIRVTFGTGVAAADGVTVYSGATAVGTATLTAPDISAGYVDVTTSTLGADGSKSLTATITDLVGNASATSGALALTIDRSAPTVTIADVLDNVAPVSGSVASGGTTDDNTPTLVLNFSEVFGAGASLEVRLDGVPILGTIVAVDADTVRFTGTDSLSDGTHEYTARMTDAAGNVGALSSAYTVIIDAIP